MPRGFANATSCCDPAKVNSTICPGTDGALERDGASAGEVDRSAAGNGALGGELVGANRDRSGVAQCAGNRDRFALNPQRAGKIQRIERAGRGHCPGCAAVERDRADPLKRKAARCVRHRTGIAAQRTQRALGPRRQLQHRRAGGPAQHAAHETTAGLQHQRFRSAAELNRVPAGARNQSGIDQRARRRHR